jgi:hypothetical protein
MAYKVRSRLQKLLEPDRVILEIDAFDIRSGRKASPVGRHDLEPLAERFLGAPGQLRVDDRAMHE